VHSAKIIEFFTRPNILKSFRMNITHYVDP